MKMNSIKKFVAMFFIAAAVFATACNKDEDKKGSLAGTSWVASAYAETITINFTTASTGNFVVYYEGGTEYDSFTYTYNASSHSGVITTSSYYSGYNSDPFTINGDVLTMHNIQFYKK